MTKYPYIADKTMYAAVMGACSYIRESGYFNKAVAYYANKYGVDKKELAQHIRARQAAGQKGKASSAKGKQYKYFIVWDVIDTAEGSDSCYQKPKVLKGISEESVIKKYFDDDLKKSKQSYTGSYWDLTYSHFVSHTYKTKAEADKKLSMLPDYLDFRGMMQEKEQDNV